MRRLLLAAALLATAGTAGRAAAQTPVGTAFTYQGRLTDAGGPVTGSYDLRFTLFDAASAGNPVGAPVTANAVAVAQGLFSATLDFGGSALGASARWLGIEVRPSGGGAFTPLTPRQRLTPAPGAVFSSFTDPANLTVLNAGNLVAGTVPDARLSGAYTQALSFPNAANAFSGTFTGNGLALTNLNAGNLASGTVPGAAIGGTYPNPVTFSNPANSFTGNGAGLTNLDAQPRYLRTVVVSPVGSATANGTALLAAVAGITPSSTNPWLLKIEPGIYDLGGSTLVMKPYLDIEGSGESVTRIRAAGNAANTVGTVHGADHAELRQLTVESTGGAAYAKAIFVDGVSTRISHVTATALGASGENQGVFLATGANGAVLSDVTVDVSASGAANAFGVLVIGAATPTLHHVTITALGGAGAHGIFNFGGAAPLLYDVQAQGLGATSLNRGMTNLDASPRLWSVVLVASGPSVFSDAVASFGTSAPRLEHVRAFAASTVGQATGIYNGPGTSPRLTDVYVEAIGGTQAWGLNNDNNGSLMDHLTVVVSGTTDQTATTVGVRNVGGAAPVITHLTVVALRGSDVVGILNSPGTPLVTHATIRVSAGTNHYGMRSLTSSSYQLIDALITVDFASGSSFGVSNEGSGGTLAQVDLQGNGASGLNAAVLNAGATAATLRHVSTSGFAQGVRNTGTAAGVSVDGSVIHGTSAAIANLNTSVMTVGSSKVMGFALNPNGGTLACVFSYNASYVALNAACQ